MFATALDFRNIQYSHRQLWLMCILQFFKTSGTNSTAKYAQPSNSRIGSNACRVGDVPARAGCVSTLRPIHRLAICASMGFIFTAQSMLSFQSRNLAGNSSSKSIQKVRRILRRATENTCFPSVCKGVSKKKMCCGSRIPFSEMSIARLTRSMSVVSMAP